MTGRHDTIGIDLRGLLVNDIICHGARPLFFLDYVAVGQMDPDQVEAIVAGVARGCREAGCALMGGETAEMPGFYGPGEYDIVGFAVGMVPKNRLIDGHGWRRATSIIGLGLYGPAAAGRWPGGPSGAGLPLGKVECRAGPDPGRGVAGAHGHLCETGAQPAARRWRCGASPTSRVAVCRKTCPWAMARRHPGGAGVGPLAGAGHLSLHPGRGPGQPRRDAGSTFNLGIGMAVIVPAAQADAAVRHLAAQGQRSWVIGRVAAGEPGDRRSGVRGSAMIRLAVMASGRGSNLAAILQAAAAGERLVGASRSGLSGPQARRPWRWPGPDGVPAVGVALRDAAAGRLFPAGGGALLEARVDVIALAGFMRLLPPVAGAAVSLAHSQRAPVAACRRFPGWTRWGRRWLTACGSPAAPCTWWMKASIRDPIVLQAAVPVLPGDTVETLIGPHPAGGAPPVPRGHPAVGRGAPAAGRRGGWASGPIRKTGVATTVSGGRMDD